MFSLVLVVAKFAANRRCDCEADVAEMPTTRRSSNSAVIDAESDLGLRSARRSTAGAPWSAGAAASSATARPSELNRTTAAKAVCHTSEARTWPAPITRPRPTRDAANCARRHTGTFRNSRRGPGVNVTSSWLAGIAVSLNCRRRSSGNPSCGDRRPARSRSNRTDAGLVGVVRGEALRGDRIDVLQAIERERRRCRSTRPTCGRCRRASPRCRARCAADPRRATLRCAATRCSAWNSLSPSNGSSDAVALLDLEAGRAELLVRREPALAGRADAAAAQAVGGDAGLGHARVAAAIRALHALILPADRPGSEIWPSGSAPRRYRTCGRSTSPRTAIISGNPTPSSRSSLDLRRRGLAQPSTR